MKKVERLEAQVSILRRQLAVAQDLAEQRKGIMDYVIPRLCNVDPDFAQEMREIREGQDVHEG